MQAIKPSYVAASLWRQGGEVPSPKQCALTLQAVAAEPELARAKHSFGDGRLYRECHLMPLTLLLPLITIKIGFVQKVSLYADDLLLYISNLFVSVPATLDILTVFFGRISGYKLNFGKSELFHLNVVARN